jgi:hypothetical protein
MQRVNFSELVPLNLMVTWVDLHSYLLLCTPIIFKATTIIFIVDRKNDTKADLFYAQA